MKGYIPVVIPTKRYIQAYLNSQLGEQPKMCTEHEIGSFFYNVLTHTTNERKTEFANVRYNAQVKVYVSSYTFRQRGANLKETNIKNFNRFIEKKIKSRFYELMDDYFEMLPSFTANLPAVRRKLGIDVEEWDDDSMRKDYYRYRIATGKPLIYDKTSSRLVPSEKCADIAF